MSPGTRIKQRHNGTEDVDRADVGTLEAIADHAGVSEIICCCLATVLSADHVIDFM